MPQWFLIRKILSESLFLQTTIWLWRRGGLKTLWGDHSRTADGGAYKKREPDFWKVFACPEPLHWSFQKERTALEKTVLIMQVFFGLANQENWAVWNVRKKKKTWGLKGLGDVQVSWLA